MPRTVRYDRLPTEAANPRSRHLDRLSTRKLLALMNREDALAVSAAGRQLPAIERAVQLIADCLRRKNRLFFVGAGTSGRLGVIEAAECPPTFHTPPSLIQAVMAGGAAAVFRSREGAEDDRRAARKRIRSSVRKNDVVVGIAASGVTPFVDEALRTARAAEARTILLTCSPRSPIAADVRITLRVGPEILAGSTRLKSGTATKLVLNMLTLASMVRLGKTHGNRMVDLRPASRKLRARASRLVESIAGVSAAQSQHWLAKARGRVKVAVLMSRKKLTYHQALRRLADCGDSLDCALEN